VKPSHICSRHGVSERRVWAFVGADRKVVRLPVSLPPATELRGQLRYLANERRRLSYRRLFILLRRKGEPSGINRIYQLYRRKG
jgi:putative transposase